MPENSIQERIEMRQLRLAEYQSKRDSAQRYFDSQIKEMELKINRIQNTLDHFRDNKVLSEMTWNAKIHDVELQIQRLQNS